MVARPTVQIREAVVPTTIDADDAADFIAATAVRNAVASATIGSDVLSIEPYVLLPNWQDEYDPKRLWVAEVDGSVVARGFLNLPIEEESEVAWITVEVLPEFRALGIAETLNELLESEARAAGRPIWQTDAYHPVLPGEQLTASTGFGTVSLADPEVARFLAAGYSLEQIERVSLFEMDDVGAIEAHRRAAAEAAGDDYDLIAWQGSTPEIYLEPMAALSALMSLDAPQGGVVWDEEVWDAERVRSRDARLLAAGTTQLWTVVLHRPSGDLVAMSSLEVPADRNRPVDQADTLVRRDHRGHRLGMLVKAANLQELRAFSPQSARVITFNAEENRPMLQVNEDLGFRPIGYLGDWKKVVEL